jgi:hypothetical protein
MVVPLKGFLSVKPSARNDAGVVVNREVKGKFTLADLKMERGVHPDHLPEVGTSWPPGMGVLGVNHLRLDGGCFLRGLCRRLCFKLCCYLSPCFTGLP